MLFLKKKKKNQENKKSKINRNNNNNKNTEIINNNNILKINENGTTIEIEWKSDIQQRYDLIGLYETNDSTTTTTTDTTTTTTTIISDHILNWSINEKHECIINNYSDNNSNIINEIIKKGTTTTTTTTTSTTTTPTTESSSSCNNNNKSYYLKYWRIVPNNDEEQQEQQHQEIEQKKYKQIYNYKLNKILPNNFNDIIIKLTHFEERNLNKSVDYSCEMFKEYSNWMSNYWDKIKHKKVRELVIPGSHDAATYAINQNSKRVPNDKIPKFIPNFMISKWSKTQSATIYKQLIMGIRYFDLRVAPFPKTGELYIFHAMFSISITEVLDDIYRFMNNNNHHHHHSNSNNNHNHSNISIDDGSSDSGVNNNNNNNNNFKREILILHWTHLYNLSLQQHIELQTMIKSKLGHLLSPRSLGTNVTVEELEKTPIINIYDDHGLKVYQNNQHHPHQHHPHHQHPPHSHIHHQHKNQEHPHTFHQHPPKKPIKKSNTTATTTSKKKKQNFDSIINEPLFWYFKDSLISNYDSNHYHSSKDVISFLNKEIKRDHQNKFWVLQCILTIDAKSILQLTFNSLFEWNDSQVVYFKKFLSTLESNKTSTNIVMTDFCTFYPIAQYAINRNINEQ